MAIRRLTISVPEEIADRIKKSAGKKAVSTWVTELIEERLDDAELDRQWEEFCRDVNPSQAEVRRANDLYRRLTTKRRKRGAA